MSTAILEPEIATRLIATDAPPVNDAAPAWLRDAQAAAWKNFNALPMPRRTDQPWRFANLALLNLDGFTGPEPVDDADKAALLERSTGVGDAAGRMVFINDSIAERAVLSGELRQKGVIWEPFETAAVAHEELFRRHFMTQEAVLGSQKFAELHKAWVRSGTFLYVPPNVEIALPIEVFHWLHGANASTFPHTLLIAGENSKVTLVDYFQSADPDAPGLACGVNDLFLEAGAKLTYVCVQNWSRSSLGFQINSTTVGRDASATALTLNLGSAYARSESVSHLAGQGGRSDMLSVSVADGAQEFDQRTLQDHCAPNTASDLLYKNSLDDKSRTIFAGLIRVEPGAHKTDAYQKVRNMLLSDDAEANSAPGLEIEADDVRCTHGATSGQVDSEEVFYLRSRGIAEKQAQRLIVHGFLQEVIDRLGNEPLGQRLAAEIHAKFGT